MLTVKQIYPTGHQEIWPTPRVTYQPANANGVDGAEETVWREGDNGRTYPMLTGSVYVMNDAGATVATYHLPSGDKTPITA
jgi:hypothetical protein